MGRPGLIAPIALAVLAAAALPVQAKPQSAYSDLDLARCVTLEIFEEGSGVRLRCRGYKGIDVAVAEGDLRFYVAYGPNADNSCAMHQTFGPFNTLGPKIEWRLENGVPYATILRWYLDKEDGGRESWLVVTRLDGDATCHVAYIEGAMPGANQRARQAADERSPGFNCYADTPQIIARPGADTSRLYPHECEKP